MQKWVKMDWRMSGVVTAPVMVPRWWMVSRMSWVMRSMVWSWLMPVMVRSIEVLLQGLRVPGVGHGDFLTVVNLAFHAFNQ